MTDNNIAKNCEVSNIIFEKNYYLLFILSYVKFTLFSLYHKKCKLLRCANEK
nr:MAG TPA: hypothetical protein [Caudoviricetes sp.]